MDLTLFDSMAVLFRVPRSLSTDSDMFDDENADWWEPGDGTNLNDQPWHI